MKLKDTRLFKGTNIDLNKITINQFPGNFTIALEGETSEFLGIVLSGNLYVKTYSYGGKNFTLKLLEEDDVFGDVLLFGNEQKKYPGSLITKGITKIAMIPNNEFKEYLKQDPNLLDHFITGISAKACEMNIQAKLLSQDTIRDKILFWIHTETKCQNSSRITLDMTKEELANQLFIQRPSLSRELSKMRKEGIIDYDRKSITILK